MKKYCFTLLMSLLMMITCISYDCIAKELKITTGRSGLTYIKIGSKIANIMGIPKENVMESKGSIENLKRLLDNQADIGITQMDAFAKFISDNPTALSEIEVIGPLYKECVFIAVNTNGKIKYEDDLQNKGVTIAVGDQNSGSFVSWDYMRQLEPGYKNSAVKFSNDLRDLGRLALQTNNKNNTESTDAVLWTCRLGTSNKMLDTVIKNKSLKLIDVDDNDLNDKLPNSETPIYTFENIPISKAIFGYNTIKTICFDAIIVIRSDMDDNLANKLTDLVLNYSETLLQ